MKYQIHTKLAFLKTEIKKPYLKRLGTRFRLGINT